MALVWTFLEWEGRWPTLSSDEYFRRTLVIPLPGIVSRDPEDGTPSRRCVVIVIAPWWLSRDALNPAKRAFIRHERALNKAVAQVTIGSPEWESILDHFDAKQPPWPFD